MVVTIPIVAVFLLDEQFVVSDYLKFVLYAAAIGVGVSSVVMFPLSLLVERLVERAKVFVVVMPFALMFVSVACLLGRLFLTGQFFDTVFGWPGLFLAFSLVFGFCWSVLWIGRVVAYGLQRVNEVATKRSRHD
jgi:hypothetical protein